MADKVKRIQRKRTKGWRIPENTVCVSRPSFRGNPYEVGKPYLTRGATTHYVTDRAMAVSLYRDYLRRLLAAQPAEIINSIRGKNLACWCPLDQPCHADVLLEIANA